MKRWFLLVAAVACTSEVEAGRHCSIRPPARTARGAVVVRHTVSQQVVVQHAAVGRSVVLGSGATIVPFAVPVAVPVAVVASPTYLYAYSAAVPGYTTGGSVGASTAAATADLLGQEETTEWHGPAAESPGARSTDDASPDVAAGADAPPDAVELELARWAASLFTQRCARCHTGQAAQGGLELIDEAGRAVPRLPRRAIYEAVAEGRMPSASEPLSAEEIELLRRWSEPPTNLAW